MSDVPSNLIPTRITQLPIAPEASEDSLMMIVYQGNNYQIRVGDLLSVAGVPTTTQVIAGTSLTGGGQLTGNVTLSVATGGITGTQLNTTGVTAGSYGDATNIPVFTVDANGRVTAASTIAATISGYVPVTRQVIAGTGLTGGGALNSNVTLAVNLSDSTPLVGDTTGSAGVATSVSRSDHQHPQVDLSSDDQVTNILGLSHGGTARSLVPNAGAMIWSGADGLYVGPAGVAGQVLVSGGTAAPTWGNTVLITDQPANVVYAGPVSGVAAPSVFRSLVNADLPASGVTANTYGSSSLVPVITVNSKGVITGVSTASIGGGTVTSVAGTGTVNGITLTGTVTSSGSLTLGGTLSGVSLTTQVSGTLPVANGGTGTTTPALVAGTNVTISGTWPNQTINATASGGSVTTVSIVSANGFTGTVANATTTPAITLTTSITGLLKGNGTAISAATSGTDYVSPGGALGTPSSGTLTNCTGLPISTGVSGLAANVATFLQTPSSANLAAALTDETGTGSAVFANAPTFPAQINLTANSGYNIYASGSADNYLAGRLGVGTATPSAKLQVTGSTSISSQPNVAAVFGAGTTSELLVGSVNGNTPFIASQGAYPLTMWTNATERLRIDSTGNVGIGGGVALNYIGVYLGKNITGNADSFGIYAGQTVDSASVTGAARYFHTSVSNTAGSNAGVYHYTAAQGTFSGAVTYQFGFNVDSTLTGATNNYGFYGGIASGTGRYNLYMAGTADNYLAGSLGIGTSSPSASAILDAQSTTKGVRFPNMTTTQKNAIPSPAAGLVVFDTTLSELCVYTGAAWQTIISNINGGTF